MVILYLGECAVYYIVVKIFLVFGEKLGIRKFSIYFVIFSFGRMISFVFFFVKENIFFFLFLVVKNGLDLFFLWLIVIRFVYILESFNVFLIVYIVLGEKNFLRLFLGLKIEVVVLDFFFI